ncbi:MAG: L-histidine N(alpha)-methyltransferase [Solirubrobacteraceae bacterium]|nr:L-histidine N(alpha)-methyltransferase [Solirubrobacteraceae bacterium]
MSVPEPVALAADVRLSVADAPVPRTLADDVLDGLTAPFRELPPKHLYDDRGSALFAEICELPEYYPTRTERSILVAHAGDVARATGAVELVELGAGYATKTRVLLDAMAAEGTLRRFVPLDVSAITVEACSAAIATEYGTDVHGIVGDFLADLDLVPDPVGPRLVAMLGGTIGNLPPGSRRHALRRIARLLDADGRLLLGVDLVKDPAVIEAAYNDGAGVTSAFNRNVLRVVNRELGADFPVAEYEHVAFFDREREWIDIRLRATREHVVHVEALDLRVPFVAGQDLRTEISSKFTPARLRGDLAAAGLRLERLLTDPAGLFGLALCAPRE